jgi:hypothetical protein
MTTANIAFGLSVIHGYTEDDITRLFGTPEQAPLVTGFAPIIFFLCLESPPQRRASDKKNGYYRRCLAEYRKLSRPRII